MVKGKTKSGFEYAYDERVLNDVDLMEAVSDFDAATSKMQQLSAVKKVADLLLGDAKEDLKAHLAEQNEGFKPFDKYYAEIYEIVNASKEIKNS